MLSKLTRRHSIFGSLVILFALVGPSTMLGAFQGQGRDVSLSTGPPRLVVSQLNAGWRQTRMGWQNTSNWWVDSFVPCQRFELIHPLVWAAMVLILVIGAMIWASEEWELARVFRRE